MSNHTNTYRPGQRVRALRLTERGTVLDSGTIVDVEPRPSGHPRLSIAFSDGAQLPVQGHPDFVIVLEAAAKGAGA